MSTPPPQTPATIADAITVTFDPTTHALQTTATLHFPDGTTQVGWSDYLQGYQYDLYLAFVGKVVPPVFYAANHASDGSPLAPTDPAYQTTPGPADVANMRIATSLPLVWSGPAQSAPTAVGAPPLAL
jgi:hypothetical protein